ncbi:MAG: tRNA uridine-5-carboxymethylaminomethyl(34) synthesis GTPase MnmE, partial [Clostridiales bacterium]|nr:tRNA uridine-5-carboxymethylaminomethyl(34) synthesis GTPase MnmE [Clostridiales bacterium]
IRGDLLNLLAHIEVTIDHPAEDIDEVYQEQIKEMLNCSYERCIRLLETADQGRLIREGIKTVIIGRPNVGKSSLLNALVRENRAIVTDIPGTTRDVIEEYINIRGILVKIIDTAGIRETMDMVEKIGVERSRRLTEDADLILLILDASEPLEKEDRDILEWLKGKNILILLNKTDKPLMISEEDVRPLTDSTIIRTSMTDGTGLDELEEYIYELVYSGGLSSKNSVMIVNNRHKEALMRAKDHLQEALNGVDSGVPLDMVSIDIRSAWEALGEITGESITENLIDKIFMKFCLGK